MSRLRIVHRTGFTYEEPAAVSYNEARMLPYSGGEQFVFQSSLDIRPGAAQHAYIDYWGTRVSTFEVLTPHNELSVTATSLVEVRPNGEQTLPDMSWDDLAAARASATVFLEQSYQTNKTEPPKGVLELADTIKGEGQGVADTALEICRAVGDSMTYQSGVTGVHSTAAEAWKERKGVCQDIAHVTLGALRAAGIPARYVSGYLHPKPDAELGETVVGESHAWVEWYSGQWHGYDPTNLLDIGERHVIVARGRDYNDVPPLRGVYAGPSASNLFVSVEITRRSLALPRGAHGVRELDQRRWSAMINHTVTFALKHAADSDEEEQFLAAASDILARIPGVHDFRVSRQVSSASDHRFQFSMMFDDEAAYAAYNAHPAHVAFLEQWWGRHVAAFQELDFVPLSR